MVSIKHVVIVTFITTAVILFMAYDYMRKQSSKVDK